RRFHGDPHRAGDGRRRARHRCRGVRPSRRGREGQLSDLAAAGTRHGDHPVGPVGLTVLAAVSGRGEAVGVPVAMSRERFEELVRDALDEIPGELLDMMANVVILVEDEAEGDAELLGLYEGHALTERGWHYGGVLPDRITIYRNP